MNKAVEFPKSLIVGLYDIFSCLSLYDMISQIISNVSRMTQMVDPKLSSQNRLEFEKSVNIEQQLSDSRFG